MKVTIEKPKIITLLYRQEKDDKDYGSCLWARFYLDTENYTMAIESDCGNYSYGWVPTPNSESFLQLLARMGVDYLLNKISSQTVVDGEATWKAVEEYMQEASAYEGVVLDADEWESIKDACHASNNNQEILDELEDATPFALWRELDHEWLWGLIEKDYSAQAKKIGSIFDTCIRPKIKELLAEETAAN